MREGGREGKKGRREIDTKKRERWLEERRERRREGKERRRERVTLYSRGVRVMRASRKATRDYEEFPNLIQDERKIENK